jgi:hypothetical protein
MESRKSSLIFPEEKETIAPATEVTIRSILARYNERGLQFAAEGIEYNPITLLTTISNLYLIKKYNTNCFMYGERAKDENFMYGGITLDFTAGQLEIPIDQIPTNIDILSQINGKNLLSQIQNFLNCIKNDKPVLIIPLLLEFSDTEHHANMLIYRKDLNIIEHFEPHGEFFDLRKNYGDKISLILQLIINKINQINNKPTNILLMPSNKVCVRGQGLQAIQSQLGSFRIEGSGYCQMWSLLFAELALLNPSMTSTNILDEIFKLLKSENGPEFLSNVIRGYVSVLGEEISLYLSEYINNELTIENISYICQIYFPYARYLSDILTFVVHVEVNVKSLFPALNLTAAQLIATDTRYKDSLSKYFRLQSEIKELLINRKRNYSIRKKNEVDAEIVTKLTEEFTEYADKRRDIKNYVQNKVFQNYLRNKQQIVSAAENPKPTRGIKKVVVATTPPVEVFKEPPKRGRKKTVETELSTTLSPAPPPDLTPPPPPPDMSATLSETDKRRSTRKKGGKKYKKKKLQKTKKYKRNKKTSRRSKS